MKRIGSTLPRSLVVLGAGFLLLASMAWSDDKDSDVDKRIDSAAKVLTEIMGTPDKAIPDKVMSKPSLGRGTAGVSSILHDDLKSRAAAAG